MYTYMFYIVNYMPSLMMYRHKFKFSKTTINLKLTLTQGYMCTKVDEYNIKYFIIFKWILHTGFYLFLDIS